MSSETGQIYIFDVAAEKLLSTYTSHAMAVRSFTWSPDSQVRIFITHSSIPFLSYLSWHSSSSSSSPTHRDTNALPNSCWYPHPKTNA